MYQNIEKYFSEINQPIQEIAKELHHFLLTFDGLYCSIKYKVPFYSKKSWVCYQHIDKKGNLHLAFTRANEFESNRQMLDFKGRTQVASIEITKMVDYKLITEIMNTALDLDEKVKYKSKRTKS